MGAAFVDLDGFKAVNDDHGHAAGDLVLVQFARELRSRSRPGDLVGRLGGDEFVVAAVLSAEQAPSFLTRWGTALDLAVRLPAASLRIRASVGTALLPPDEVGELLSQADRAMYLAKHSRIPLARSRA